MPSWRGAWGLAGGTCRDPGPCPKEVSPRADGGQRGALQRRRPQARQYRSRGRGAARGEVITRAEATLAVSSARFEVRKQVTADPATAPVQERHRLGPVKRLADSAAKTAWDRIVPEQARTRLRTAASGGSGAVVPGNRPGSGANAGKCTLSSAVNVKPAQRASPDPRPWLRPPSVAVRAKPTVPRTAPWPRFPSAMRPWTPQLDGSQRDKMTHHGTTKNTPPAREFAASGGFSQRVAGVGFEPT